MDSQNTPTLPIETKPSKTLLQKYWWVLLLIAVALIIVLILLVPGLFNQNSLLNNQTSQQQATIEPKWVEQGPAVAGNYADSDVVKLDNGTFRMYYAIEPEVPGNNHEIYSATSSDGKTWTQEDGVRLTGAAFPDVFELPDGTWRMNVQGDNAIISYKSSDGLSWSKENGVRIDTKETDFTIDRVAAPTTLKVSDGLYIMVYVGSSSTETYSTLGPNSGTSLLFWATSADGFTWIKKGIAVDSRNETLLGNLDGPDLYMSSDGVIHLYFFDYLGIYESTFSNGVFSDPTLVYPAPNPDNNAFPSNPPGDPSVIEIDGTLFMYYGYHTKGIYYAIRE